MKADKHGNVRTYYMVGEPSPVHDPLVLTKMPKAKKVRSEPG